MLLWLAIFLVLTQPVIPERTQVKRRLAKPETLKSYVTELSSVLPERSDDVDKLNKSAEFIQNIFARYTSAVVIQEYDVWGIPYRNVIAKFGSLDSPNTVVIGAHYDSFDGFPGADDNASGVAGLLELARLFAQQPPNVEVQLVAYCLEEPPYFFSKQMGSYSHAQLMAKNAVAIKLMISLEMIGYFSDEKFSQEYPLPLLNTMYPEIGNFIAVVGRFNEISEVRFYKKEMMKVANLPVHSINAPPFLPGINFSDHLNYWRFDFPAIMITDTAFYRNKNYHTQLDTWEKLDYQRMSLVVDAVYYATSAFLQNKDN